MRFSLIVCTLGRRDELVGLFDSLVRQNRADFETIVVDQNTDDRLVEVVAQFANRFPLKHIRMTGTGASRARNLGLDHATGELIGFPDDDCQYFDRYLDLVDQVFSEDPSIGCISGYPTASISQGIGADWQTGRMDLDPVNVLNRCQEFTIFLRRENLHGLRYNERLGVGAQTLWGAEEGPDFLIRLVHAGCRLIYFPFLFIYHPDKIATITPRTLQRALSYASGRGCLLRLHHFPQRIVFAGVLRPMIGCILFLLKGETLRSKYYFNVASGTLRGLLMSRAELAHVREGARMRTAPIQPVLLPPLPSQPLVSVLIANYNYARFLPATLDSLLAQTYHNWQAIVCDDGSIDDSVKVIQRYADRDPRIQLVKKSNGGQNSAFNTCYREVCGQIVCLLDADDLFDRRKIHLVVQSFHANPEAGVCNHFSQVIDSDGHPRAITMHRFLDSGWLANQALSRGACVYVPTTSCMSIRREIADLLFPIPERQDRDLDGYIGMAAQFLAPFCIVHEPLSSYRIHAHNMGGLTEPTPQRLRYELHLIELRTATLKQFLSKCLGEELAARIALEDNPQYLQAALKLLAIENTDRRLPRALALIPRHPNPHWRALWRAVFAAPRPLSRLAVPLMHRSYRVKAVIHGLMDRTNAMNPTRLPRPSKPLWEQ
jgi:glycosyltransferase involved in cell wall biosynthesis